MLICKCVSFFKLMNIMWIYSCVDTSGRWGRGGLFDALVKLSTSISDAYEQASEHGDLHLGDLHLIRLEG